MSIFAAMKQKLENILAFLFRTDWNAHLTMNFEDVCKHFDVAPANVDNLLYDIFGMSGDEIIEQYRQGPMSVNLKRMPLIEKLPALAMF